MTFSICLIVEAIWKINNLKKIYCKLDRQELNILQTLHQKGKSLRASTLASPKGTTQPNPAGLVSATNSKQERRLAQSPPSIARTSGRQEFRARHQTRLCGRGAQEETVRIEYIVFNSVSCYVSGCNCCYCRHSHRFRPPMFPR